MMATGKKFAELMGLTQTIEPVRGERRPTEPRTAPGQMINALTGRDEAIARAEAAEAELQAIKAELVEAKKQGGALEIEIERLHEVPGRRRKLTQEEYEDLKNNLAHNALASPITVRVRSVGEYEIVSGHNRVQVYRDLGRKTIKAWLAETSEEEAEDLAFFANALAAKLPDYDKYRGYERLLTKYPNIEQNELASRSGVSKSLLSKLLTYRHLPAGAHDVLANHPHLIGAAASEKLAGLMKEGREQYVVEALQKLAAGDLMTEAEAVRFAKEAGVTKVTKASKERKFKVGRSTYATLRRVSKTVRIDCVSEEEAEEINKLIEALLDQRVASKSTEKDS